MNKKRKTQSKQRTETIRAHKLRRGGVVKNKAAFAREAGVARSGKQARKQLRSARRSERNKEDDAVKAGAYTRTLFSST